MTDDRLRDAAVAHSAAVLAFVDEVRAARAGQWEAPPRADLHTAMNLYADPVGETVANADRLRLRAAVEAALLTLTEATASLDAARADVARAAAPFNVKEYAYLDNLAA